MRVPSLHLTFDDGPDPVWTPRVLAALARAGGTATFFVLAGRAAAHPELVEAQLAAGHAVELHCLEHVRHTRASRAWVERDTAGALSLLDGLGVAPRRWRVPWGRTAPWTAEVAARHGLALTRWSADTHDWRGDAAAAMVRVLAPAAVVLCHDGLGPGARRDGCEETVRLIELAAAQGWTSRRLPGPAAVTGRAA